MLVRKDRGVMRILHIIGTMDPRAGGPTESVRTLLEYGPAGYTGEVVTLDDPSATFLKGYDFPGARNGSDARNVWLRSEAAEVA